MTEGVCRGFEAREPVDLEKVVEFELETLRMLLPAGYMLDIATLVDLPGQRRHSTTAMFQLILAGTRLEQKVPGASGVARLKKQATADRVLATVEHGRAPLVIEWTVLMNEKPVALYEITVTPGIPAPTMGVVKMPLGSPESHEKAQSMPAKGLSRGH